MPRAASSSLSPYEALGVRQSASAEEVRESYLRLTKLLHPDLVAASSDEEREAAAEQFREVQAAWYVLGDTKRRSHFDVHGSLPAPPTAWSPLMWAKLRMANVKPGDGALSPNWGTEEPPLWLVICGPFSVLFLAMVLTSRQDILEMARDRRALREGAWPCEVCLILNEASAEACKQCGGARFPHRARTAPPGQ